MRDYIGAIDQGTTSSRFVVFDRQGRIVTIAQRVHDQIFPRAGWVEHDPIEIRRQVEEVIAEAMQAKDLRPSDLAAIGIANQRETAVLWSKSTGRPIYNAVVWQDTRVSEMVAGIARERGQDCYRAKTGLPLSTYFSGLKIRWILNEIPGAGQAAKDGDLLFGTIDTFIIWNLTGGPQGGVHVTDVTNASRTQLMNLKTLDWDEEILSDLGIPREILPRIASSAEVYGDATLKSVRGVPIAGDLGDQQAALFGQACFHAGQTKNTYGTGCFMLMNTGANVVPSTCGLITTVGYKLGRAPAAFALEGSIAITGALVQWLRDNLNLIQTSADVEMLALTVNDNGGAYFVPAFSGLYAPYWKDSARGVIAGLTRYVNKGHLARAVLEATAYQVREIVDAMQRDAGIMLDSLRVDGGMVGNQLLMQFQADILNKHVVRPVVRETTALGAAYAAGLAVGFFRDTAELERHWTEDHRWKPAMEEQERERLFRLWNKAVSRSLDWAE